MACARVIVMNLNTAYIRWDNFPLRKTAWHLYDAFPCPSKFAFNRFQVFSRLMEFLGV